MVSRAVQFRFTLSFNMPRVTERAVTSCMHCVARARRQASALIICGTPGITYGRAVRTS